MPMTRDEIDSKLTDDVLSNAEYAFGQAYDPALGTVHECRRAGVAAMRAVLSSALQGEPERGKTTVGSWPERCVQRAFVDGAAWHQWKTTGATPWSHERDEYEDEAVKRYGEPDPPPPTTEGDRP